MVYLDQQDQQNLNVFNLIVVTVILCNEMMMIIHVNPLGPVC